MYTGGTTLLTETYTPAEKAEDAGAQRRARVHGDGHLVVLLRRAGQLPPGWERMNLGALPFLRRSSLARPCG